MKEVNNLAASGEYRKHKYMTKILTRKIIVTKQRGDKRKLD